MAYSDWLEAGKIIDDCPSFNALVFAMFEMCPREKLGKFRAAFPAHWREFKYRTERPDGILPGDPIYQTEVGRLDDVRGRFQPQGGDYPPEFIRRTSAEEEEG